MSWRRQNLRLRRAQRYAPATAGNFGALFTGVLQYLRADLGVTQTGGIVSAWADQSGNGVNVTQGSGAGIGNVTAGLNGHAGIGGNGTTQFGNFTLNLPAPSITPTFYWTIWRLMGATGNPGNLLGGASHLVFVNQATTNCFFNNGGSGGPVTTEINAWGRLEVAFTHSAADYIKFGSQKLITGDVGNNAASAHTILANLNAEILVHIALNNIPSQAVLDAASAAATSYYGNSVAV